VLNNENLASGSSDNTIVIWQKTSEISFKLSNTLTGHTDRVISLVVLPNNMFASTSGDKSIRIWDQITFQCILILNGHTDSVRGLVVIRNEYLISISFDKTIIVWDISNSFSKITTTRTSESLYSLALFSNDSFITGDSGGTLKSWDINSFRINYLIELEQSSNYTSSLLFYIHLKHTI